MRKEIVSGIAAIIILFLLGTTNMASEKEDNVLETDSPPLFAEVKDEADDAVSRSGIDQLTNRRKVLAKDADLKSVAYEDIVAPSDGPRLVIMAASASVQEDEDGHESTELADETAANTNQAELSSSSAAGCEPIIGLTYKDSVPCWPESPMPPKGAPNVVFLVLDDVGFGGLGCFGGPVDTPNIDRLAQGGLSYNNFHTTAICSPTRACLLTGRNHHSVGAGVLMELPSGYPGYTTYLSKSAATMPEMLLDQGYNTYCVGKWHLAPSATINAAGPYDQWPLGRGFERYYGFLESHTNQWYPDLVYDNHRIDPPATPEEGYHLSTDLVNRSIEFLSDGKSVDSDRPFFLYLAFGAGHWPHHAPKEYIDKYEGRFDEGWDVVRNETLARQKALGIIPEDTELPPRDPYVKAWDDLTDDEKRVYARLAEVHAGYVDYTDEQIGRFIDYLEETGLLNNTMIVVISDNGASPEGDANGYTNTVMWVNGMSEGGDSSGFQEDFIPVSNISMMLAKLDELGGPTTYPTYPLGWAMADNTPNKLYKWTSHEGGTHDPMIIYWPAGIEDQGGIRTQYCHVIDVVPTVLEVLGMEAPDVYNGVPQKPVEGTSIAYTFDNADEPTHKTVQYFEMMGTRGLWYGGWKAVAFHHLNIGANFDEDVWELYNLAEDVSESEDLAALYPDKLQEMQERWWAEASRYNVLPLDDRSGARYDPVQKTGTFTYEPGLEKIMEPDIPDTHNSSYTITAFVDIPDSGAEGVLFSIGGRFAGLSLYVLDDHLVYDYNFLGLRHYTVKSEVEVPTGPATLGFAFNKTGTYQGEGTLFVNGEEQGRISMPRVVPIRYSFEEGLEVGKDPQTPVSESYESPFVFDGTLKKVVMEVED